jgi:crotonobetainyl-CoA:carnitine CoA-transferase CaiB-like acyl-CoA transferase
VKKINPRIVYCSITGFGQDGPYANRAGYDFVVQGMGGLMSVTGQPDGAPGAAPMKVGVAISDEMSGMNALSGILAALLGREKSGEGSYIEVSLLESTVHALINQASNYLVSGDVPVRLGNDHPTIVPYSALPTKDGHIILAIGNDGQFQRFCEAAGIGHVATDPKYAINSQRIAHREELLALISARLTQETSTYWIDLLESRAVPCGPIYRMDEMFQDPHIIARGVRRETTKGAAAPLPVVANPIRMPGQDTTSSKAPPMLGEDTDSVLSSILGLTPDKIATLRKSGAI